MDQVVRPDFRKSLPQLCAEWEGCTKCSLGERRAEVGGSFVFGEGRTRGIMFIGEGPGRDEEIAGRPFIGRSGKVLRHLINKLALTDVYITNVVACRSCGPSYDPEGNVRKRRNYHTGEEEVDIRDMPPLPVQMQACLPRLYEEIYLVDPLLIVALGGPSAEILSGSPAKVLSESGVTKEITIPGAGHHANLTAKKQVWLRKVRGEMIMPVDQNEVRYLMMTLVHPAHVLRKRKDQRLDNPMQIFLQGMKKAADIYERQVLEIYGDAVPAARDLTEEDFLEAIEE